MATKNYNSKTDDYMTPPEIYQPILDFIGIEKFETDVCCTKFEIPANRHYTVNGIFEKPDGHHSYTFTQSTDGLNSNWHGHCFMNPPWKYTPTWFKKAINENKINNNKIWCVLPGDRLNMKYFNEVLRKQDNWFMAVLENNNYNFINPHQSEEQNQLNIKNGGFKKPILILYIGDKSHEYAQRWQREQPLPSLVLKGVI